MVPRQILLPGVLVSLVACRAPSREMSRGSPPAMTAAASKAEEAPTPPVDGGSPSRGPGYPVDTTPPRDVASDGLLDTLRRESSAIVVCRLGSLTDLFPTGNDPDVFYDAACDVGEVLRGPVSPHAGRLEFVWQVERGARMPPLGAELLVHLKARKEPLDGPRPLKWVALDAGVHRYTDTLRAAVHARPQKAR